MKVVFFSLVSSENMIDPFGTEEMEKRKENLKALINSSPLLLCLGSINFLGGGIEN